MEKESYIKLSPEGRKLFKQSLKGQEVQLTENCNKANAARVAILNRIKAMEDGLKKFKKESETELGKQLNLVVTNDRAVKELQAEQRRIQVWDEELAVRTVRETK